MKKAIITILIVALLWIIGTVIPSNLMRNKISLDKFDNCVLDSTKKNLSGFIPRLLVKKVTIDHQDKDDAIYTRAYTFFGIPYGTYKLTHVVMGSDNACTATVTKQ